MQSNTVSLDEQAPTKVLVRSKFKEVRAITGYAWEPEKQSDGTYDMVRVGFERQFINHECMMSLEESKFLVEDISNKRCEDAGDPRYWYPAGMAVPVPVNFRVDKYGPFTPPQRTGSGLQTDPLASEGAMRIAAEKKAAMEAFMRQNAKVNAEATVQAQKDAAAES